MKRLLVTLALASLLVAVSTSVAFAGPEMQRGNQIHFVSFGETLFSIAARYGVTVEAILRQNGLVNPDKIYVGQPLEIPGAGYYPNPTGFIGSPNLQGCSHYYTVRPGETLSSIAYQNGTTVRVLLEGNRLYNQDFVYVGQRICVPPRIGFVPEQSGYQPVHPYYHSVVPGETLSGIAYHYGVDQMNILRANNLNNSGFIWVGQRLMIPDYQPAPQHDYSVPSVPAYDYDQGPKYVSPPARPPAAPLYDNTHDDYHKPPPYEPPPHDGHSLPAPPDYQPGAAFPLLPLAEHEIEVAVNGGESWVGQSYPVSGTFAGITTLIVNIDEKLPEDELPLVKIRSGDYEVNGMLGLLPEYGIDRLRFAFPYIPPGDYDVWLVDPAETPSEKVEVRVEAGKRVEVAFTKGVSFSGPTFASPDGWFLASWDNPSKPGQNIGGWSNILVKTPASGLNVIIESEGGGYRAKCFTGTKGPGACDFAGLNAGLYFIHIDGTKLTLKTYMDGNAYATFEFARQPGLKEDRDKVGPVSYD